MFILCSISDISSLKCKLKHTPQNIVHFDISQQTTQPGSFSIGFNKEAILTEAACHICWSKFSELTNKPDFICGGKKATWCNLTISHTIPRHFEGGDWDTGGSCQRLRPLMPQQNNGTNMEARFVNVHLQKVLKGTANFSLLDITSLSEFRADAHGRKKHDDCMHWCIYSSVAA